MNDHELKKMYITITDIHAKVKVIETKCTSMDKHLETQNGRLNKHAEEIGDLEVAQQGLKVGQKYHFLIIGALGASLGTIITILLRVFSNGGVL